MSKAGVSIWKILMLIFVGFCGLYFCWLGVDRKLLVRSMKRGPMQKNIANSCSRALGSMQNYMLRHYPKPKTYSRGDCTCSPVRYFAILSMQRSGSGWFETLLNSHPHISSHGEVFSVKSRRANFSAISETLDMVYNLDWFSSASKNECTAAVGFKWMLNQRAMEYSNEVLTYFNRRGVFVIFLMRHNLLKRLVSVLSNAYDREMKLLNGTHKSHVHSEEEAQTLASYQPIIDTELLVANLQQVQKITNDAVRFFNSTRHMLIYYEDLVKHKNILNDVQQFLGVLPMKLESQHVKIHKKPLRDQIANWGEVSKVLRGTGYEKFLNENDLFFEEMM